MSVDRFKWLQTESELDFFVPSQLRDIYSCEYQVWKCGIALFVSSTSVNVFLNFATYEDF